MPIPTPSSAAEIERRAKVDVQRELPTSNPFLQNSWLGGMITAFSYRIFDFYLTLLDLAKESIPDTAVATLSRWASVWGFTRLTATGSSGNLVAVGVLSTVIPINTVFTASDGKLYTSDSQSTINASSFSIAATMLTSDGAGTATCETPSPHGFASNVTISVTTATQTEYNVAVGTLITVVSANQFTYPITGTPVSPATGSPTVNYSSAIIPVKSNELGISQNQILDTVLSLQVPIAGVITKVSVDFGTLGGGTEQEEIEVFRARYLDTLRNPVAHFNVSDIIKTAKGVNGVTRVFVRENTPLVGQCEVYFMRDNDVGNGVPSPANVATVNNAIQLIRPATTVAADVAVAGPTPVVTPYDFASISPDTPGMRVAINAALDQFYAAKATMGVAITKEDYSGAIANASDIDTGVSLLSFDLTTPTIDIPVAVTSIGVKGAVTF